MNLPSGTVTFLFTDIEGSTKLWEQHPDQMRPALAQHDALLRAAIDTNQGAVVKTTGDGFHAAFAKAEDALTAAMAAQRALTTVTWESGLAVRVRMALHTGVAEERDGDYYGQSLNRAARLLSIGHGGQVLLSEVTQALSQDHLPASVTFKNLGEHRLRDLGRTETVFQLLHPDLPPDFPPLRSLDNPTLPNNLPQQLTSFIGREKEMAEVKRLLSATRLLTVVGAGGSGKTRLALQAAADLLDAYQDGVWLVEFAALSEPGLVPQAVAQVLDVREEPGKEIQQVLVEHLKGKALLLVLDNCEHLISACAHLSASLLRVCTSVRILATSREALGIAGETTYRIPSLSLPDTHTQVTVESFSQYEAARLFIERAVAVVPGFTVTNQNAPSLASICHHLDGIPLAIELAAARIRSLSLQEIDARLDDRFRLLTGGSRTSLPRQQTLRATIDWSYDLLSEPERLLLCRLSVFAGGCTLTATERICAGEGIEEWEVVDLLLSLVDKSLVSYEEERGEARYRLLETVRQYARAKLLEGEEAEAVRDRHADYFRGLAEEADPHLNGAEQGVWLNQLDAEHDNFRTALQWSLAEERQIEAGVRIAAVLWRFWFVRGYLSEGRKWLQLAGERGTSAPLFARGRVVGGESFLAFFQGDYECSWLLCVEACALCREAGDIWGLAFHTSGRGIMSLLQGNSEQSHACFEESVTLSRELGEKWLLGFTLTNAVLQAFLSGDLEQTEVLLEESLSLLREVADQWFITTGLLGLARVRRHRDRYEEAAALDQEALVIGVRLRDRRAIAGALVGLASFWGIHGQGRRSVRLLGAAEVLREAIGAPINVYERHDYERCIEIVHEGLEEEVFAALWAEGRAMTQEQAIAYALEEAQQ